MSPAGEAGYVTHSSVDVILKSAKLYGCPYSGPSAVTVGDLAGLTFLLQTPKIDQPALNDPAEQKPNSLR